MESPSSASDGAGEDRKRLKWHLKFAYQKFEGWRPILNVASAQIFFISAGLFCIALGIPILTASLTVSQYSVRYDDQGPFSGLDSDAQQQLLWMNANQGVPLTVELQVDSDLQPPVSCCRHVLLLLHLPLACCAPPPPLPSKAAQPTCPAV
jgi:hypothetical protein